MNEDDLERAGRCFSLALGAVGGLDADPGEEAGDWGGGGGDDVKEAQDVLAEGEVGERRGGGGAGWR